MAKLAWDQVGERIFETGIDRAVLYSPHHLVSVDDTFRPQGFVWNGLKSVDEKAEKLSVTPIYFDGQKRFDIVDPGDFSASMKALTYPDEFLPFDGMVEFIDGMFFDNQPRDTFGLSYRTLIGNDVDGTELGYKIHILYNLTAIPDSVSHQTIGSNVAPIDFGWTITGVPESYPGYRPTCHLILDSTKINSEVIGFIEDVLYGTEDTTPILPSITELLSYVTITITDHGDGSWTAEGPDYLVQMVTDISFELDGVNVIHLNDHTYELSA